MHLCLLSALNRCRIKSEIFRLPIWGFVTNGGASSLTHTGILISSHISSLSTTCCASLTSRWSRVRKGVQRDTKRGRSSLCSRVCLCRYKVLMWAFDLERGWMCDGKWCPEERSPTVILLPSSSLPTGSCDRVAVKLCPIGNKNFSLHHQSLTHFSVKTEMKKPPTSWWCAWHFFWKCQRVTFVATCNKVRQFPYDNF